MTRTSNSTGIAQTGQPAAEPKAVPFLGTASFALALLQSLCTAVLTVSGIRVAIGLTALAAASGIYAPARGWHQDAIRIPMLVLASAVAARRAMEASRNRCKREALGAGAGAAGRGDTDPCGTGGLDAPDGAPD